MKQTKKSLWCFHFDSSMCIMSVRMQKHVELLDSFPKPSSKMQQYLVSEMKTHTSANAHRLGPVKMMRERQIYCHTWKEKKILQSGEDNYRITAVKIVLWSRGFCWVLWGFFPMVEIDLLLHSTFLFMLLRHAIKIAIQKSILYLNVRRLRFQLFLSKRVPTENIPAHSLVGGNSL